MNDCNCNKTDKKECRPVCGCAEPVFSVESMPEYPTILRFNVNGKSVWYDFSPVIKAAETCTALNLDAVNRNITFHGECADSTITAQEFGRILHLGDIGDVDAESIDDNGILTYKRSVTCPEGCEGQSNVWKAVSPVDAGTNALNYVLGADSEGSLGSLMPPTDANKFAYLAWRAQDKAGWRTPREAATPPLDGDSKAWRLYVDPDTLEFVIVKEAA